MFATTRSLTRHLGRVALATLPFTVVACETKGVDAVRSAEASTPTTTTVTEPIKMAPTLVTGVLSDATIENGDAAYKAGKYKEAAAAFRMHVTTSQDAHSYYMLGLSSWKAGDFEGAEKAFEKSITLDSGFAKSYFNKGRVLLDLKRAPEAIEIIVKGLAIDSTSPDGWRLKARAQSENGDVTAAFTTYKEIVVRDETDGWTLNNLGMFFLSHNCNMEALGPLARAVQVRPTAPLFRNNFGMALERAGYPIAALHQYEQAVRDDSTFTKAVRNLARLKALVPDTNANDEVTTADLAEQFRQRVIAWKTEPKPSEVKTEVKPEVPPMR
jgi:tetratricopeptide (TPR) repeat protein